MLSFLAFALNAIFILEQVTDVFGGIAKQVKLWAHAVQYDAKTDLKFQPFQPKLKTWSFKRPF